MVLDLGGSGKPKNKKFQGHQLNIEINKKKFNPKNNLHILTHKICL